MWALISSSGYIYFYMDAKLDIFYFDFLIFFHLEMRKKKIKSWFSCKVSVEEGEWSELLGCGGAGEGGVTSLKARWRALE